MAQNYKWVTGGGSDDDAPFDESYQEQVSYMCTDAHNNLYISAVTGINSIKLDTFIANSPNIYSNSSFVIGSYDCNGQLRWAKLFDAYDYATSYGIAYDGAANIYCVGILLGENKHIGNDTAIGSIYYNSFLAKFDTSGKFKWIRFIGDDTKASYGTYGPTNILIDGKGYIHDYPLMDSGVNITSTLISREATYDLKYDSSGNLISARRMQIDSTRYIRAITMNKKNNNVYAYIVGSPAYSVFVQTYITAFDTSDNSTWVDSGSLQQLRYDENNGLYGFSRTNPIVIGTDTVSKNHLTDIVKLDTNGHVIKDYGFYGSGTAILDLALLPNGRIAATGEINGDLVYNSTTIHSSGNYPLLVVLDTSGSLYKLDYLHGLGASLDMGMAITSDNNNNIYVGGEIEDYVSAGSLTPYYSHGGTTDFFVAKYGYNCDCTPSTEPTPMFTATDSVPALNSTKFTYAGTITPDSVKWNFGDGTTSTITSPIHSFTDTGVFQVCLTTYACDSGTYCQYIKVLPPTEISSVNAFGNIRVYPNPMGNQLFIGNAENGDKVKLYDVMGREVYHNIINCTKYFINTNDLSVGTYLLELTDKYGKKESMTIVKQ